MKKFLVITLIISTIISTNVFAYKWVKSGDDWYVQNDNVAVCKTNELLNENGLVYYFDEDGKMCKGWFYKPQNEKVYFFDNDPSSKTFGSMVFGLKTIDGYLRYFNAAGELVMAPKQGEYVNAYGDYWADVLGNLYLNNKLQVDTSTKRSDYYTDLDFYTYRDKLNNSNVSENRMVTWSKVKEKQTGHTTSGNILTPVAQ